MQTAKCKKTCRNIFRFIRASNPSRDAVPLIQTSYLDVTFLTLRSYQSNHHHVHVFLHFSHCLLPLLMQLHLYMPAKQQKLFIFEDYLVFFRGHCQALHMELFVQDSHNQGSPLIFVFVRNRVNVNKICFAQNRESFFFQRNQRTLRFAALFFVRNWEN